MLAFLLVGIAILVQTPFGQNWLVGQATKRLSRDLKTRIEIKHVDFSLFNNMLLQGVLIEDQKKDTLLYAGEVKVKVTDWFFIKKTVELEYIGLKDATINLNRTDSVWNHQFLIDKFSSPSGGGASDTTSKLFLKEVDLHNIAFHKKDAWLGQDLNVMLTKLSLEAKDVNLYSKTINLGTIRLEKPYVSLYSYPQLKPKSEPYTIKIPIIKDKEPGLKWNAAGWALQAENISITDGVFKTDNKTNRAPFAEFDGSHIEFRSITGSLSGIRWEKDSITAKLDLKTKERSGFEVKSLLADVKVSPKELAFQNLDLQTGNSHLRDYFKMSFDDFSNLSDFVTAVKMEANFTGARVSSDDIAFFAPAVKSWKKQIDINGKITGPVSELAGQNLEIDAGNNTHLRGDITLSGLPDINQTFIDFKAKELRTTYSDAEAFVPAIRQISTPDLRKLQYIQFTGNFTGFIKDFVTYGTIQTHLGTIRSDLNMKLPDGGQPVYSGTFSTDHFNLGTLLNDPDIGAINMTGNVKGTGFDPKKLNTILDAKIRYLDYRKYRYDNITVKGTLNRNRFEGNLSANDPEAQLTLNGLIDFSKQKPEFRFLANVNTINLKKTNLLNEDIAFTGKLDLDFTGNNIDNFLGTATISEATLVKDGIPLPFDSLVLASEYDADVKKLTVRSNEFDATITGSFRIMQLPDAVKLLLNKYYPAYVPAPHRIPTDANFQFDVNTRYVEDYIKMIDSSLAGFNNSHIYGSVDTRKEQMVTLNGEIPQFKYKQYNFDDVRLTAKGNEDSLAMIVSAININISDSLNIPLALISVNARHDSSKVKILTGANQTINQANIQGLVLTYSNGVKIEFDPSSFTVNGKNWTIDESGELEFRTNVPPSGQLILRESNQEIKLRTQSSATGKWNDLLVELKKVNLGDFTPFFMPHNRVEGLISGQLTVENPGTEMIIRSDEILAEDFRLDNDSIGNIRTNLYYNNITKELIAKGKNDNEENNIAFNLKLNLGDPELQKNNLIQLSAKRFGLKILERFLGTLFSDINGYITGNFQLAGELEKLQITGKGRLQDAGLKVNFTQCYYKVNETDITLGANELNLDNIVLTDTVTGNPIYLSGGIQHQGYKNMFFDLVVSTRKPGTTNPANNLPVLVLNTNFRDNSSFYGKVYSTGSFSLSGFETDMFMKIDAIASSSDSSTVTLPISSSRESGIADFLVERKYGREMTEDDLRSKESNVVYEVDLAANPMVNVRVILDPLTGDEIKGKGRGSLHIRSGTNEKMTMRGRFDIEEGNYLFTFKSFFKKPFVLRRGADNYIVWNGDPYAAQIRFEAMYTAENVSFAPLVQGLDLNQSYSRQREDVYVIAILTGNLFKPDFKFALDFTPNSITKNDFAVSSGIEKIERDEGELLRQVTYLIVTNSFIPPGSTQATGGVGNAINEFTTSTITSLSGLFFNEINNRLNNELSKILKTDNLSLNFGGSLYNRNLLTEGSNGSSLFNQSTFNSTLKYAFSERFVVSVGTTLDVPLQSSVQQTVQFLPDVTMEWLINQSGTIRASFFYKQNLDYLTTNTSGAGRTKRSGASLSYRKEFNNIGDLFRKRKMQPAQPDTIPPANPQKDSTLTTNRDE